jgi:hypothetical protein
MVVHEGSGASADEQHDAKVLVGGGRMLDAASEHGRLTEG